MCVGRSTQFSNRNRGLDIIENPDDLMAVMLGYNRTVQRPKRTVEMKFQILDFPETCETFTVMPVPEGKDVMLRMKWLRENNPDIDWERLLLHPRATTKEPSLQLVLSTRPPARMIGGHHFKNARQDRDIIRYYRQHGHSGGYGETKIISSKQFLKELRKGMGIESVFAVNPHDSGKAEPYEALVKYRDTVYRTELPSSTPPVREGIEHEIQLHPGTQPISVKQWRQSPEQRKVFQDWTKEMVQAGIIHPSTSAFKPDRLRGYYKVKLCESDIPFTAFSTPDGLFEYLVSPMGLSGSPDTFIRLLQRVFSDLRDVMRIYFDDIYVNTQDQDVQMHV
ncbi:hypothetical protein PHMEG_00022029 [Phytophthora megakarya]|uniref:Reverse transcriptase domain-containing protein n=1 Tax=Phytophthora megakarya TaxID=4795 RepID=A0A225VLD1_9STRA|nr:hypothetical protein PHMEG_00022029 [Phytophthora megakarya]